MPLIFIGAVLIAILGVVGLVIEMGLIFGLVAVLGGAS